MHPRLENVNVRDTQLLAPPATLKQELAASEPALATVTHARDVLKAILEGRDNRRFAVVGPCSIHDPVAALEYAHKLKALADEVSDVLYIVMRAYFEKPRTTVGWKGLVNDPHMDDSFDIDTGLRIARRLLIDINALGVPTATEALDPISPQYLGDLIAWAAIGARTTESQTHREMASGLSMPVGFKNGTDGNLGVAVNAMLSAARPHAFLGVDEDGRVAVVRTAGNQLGHVILRGGAAPNHDSVSVLEAAQQMRSAGLAPRLVVDCSHGNSHKNPALQPRVLADVISQCVADAACPVLGVMLESNLVAGAQKLDPSCPEKLVYGQSVTDGCIGWEETEVAIRAAADQLRRAR